MFNNPTPKMSRERSTIIAIQNLQSDLRAGFTAARDMSSHGNGYADVELRDAINRGDIDGPRLCLRARYTVERRAAQREGSRQPARRHGHPFARGRARGRP